MLPKSMIWGVWCREVTQQLPCPLSLDSQPAWGLQKKLLPSASVQASTVGSTSALQDHSGPVLLAWVTVFAQSKEAGPSCGRSARMPSARSQRAHGASKGLGPKKAGAAAAHTLCRWTLALAGTSSMFSHFILAITPKGACCSHPRFTHGDTEAGSG